MIDTFGQFQWDDWRGRNLTGGIQKTIEYVHMSVIRRMFTFKDLVVYKTLFRSLISCDALKLIGI